MANLEFFSAAGTATEAGIFFPTSDLPGLTGTELSSGSAAFKRDSFAYSFLKAIRKVVTTVNFLNTPQDETDPEITKPNKLGMTLGTVEASGGVGLKNRTLTLTTTWLGDKTTNTISMVPVADTGNFSGMGDLGFIDVFANAVKVAAAGNTPGAGVLVPSSELVFYGSEAHAGIDLATDGRRLITAIANWLLSKELVLREATVESAFTALTSTSDVLTVPAAAINATNPSSALDTDTSKYFLVNDSLIFTINTIDDDDESIKPNTITG